MTVRAILADPAYLKLKQYVLNHTGLAYYADKDEDFSTRVARRFAVTQAPSCAAYLALLDAGSPKPSEMDALVGELTIGETYFFRQSEHFDLLRSTIFPDLLRRNSDSRKLRIWSAGCATGAEPYSLAVMLHTEFAAQIQNWDVSILGTDINPEFLAQAREGNYSEWALREVPEEQRKCCFRQEGRRWILAPKFRHNVTFQYHNLAVDSDCPSPDGKPWDLILCRNVVIYFSHERSCALASQFYRQLADGGWLLVGHAESSLNIFQQFQLAASAGTAAYRKDSSNNRREDIALPVWQPWRDPSIVPPPESAAEDVPLQPDTLGPWDPEPGNAPADLAPTIEDARVHADRGDWPTAEAVCRRLLADNPLNAPAHFILGLILAHTQPIEAAIAELRRAIYADRQFALAFYHLGTLLQTAGCIEDARKAYRNALAVLEERPPDETVEHGDGISAGELSELARMHQEVIGE